MRDRNSPSDYIDGVAKVFNIVKSATLEKVRLPETNIQLGKIGTLLKRLESKGKLVFMGVVVAVAIMIITAVLAYFLEYPVLLSMSKIASAISIIIWFAYMAIVILGGLPNIVHSIKAPFEPILSSVQHALETDQRYLEELKEIDEIAIRQVLASYRTERLLWERRGALLSGSIDRVGLFPALGAVALLYLGLGNFGGGGEWVQMLVPIIVFFHFMNFLAFGMYQKIDRIISMLEISIEVRKKAINS